MHHIPENNAGLKDYDNYDVSAAIYKDAVYRCKLGNQVTLAGNQVMTQSWYNEGDLNTFAGGLGKMLEIFDPLTETGDLDGDSQV